MNLVVVNSAFVQKALKSIWLQIGFFLTSGGAAGVAVAVAIRLHVLSIASEDLPAPADFIAGHLLPIGLIPIAVGGLVLIGAVALWRGDRRARSVRRPGILVLMVWLFFLAVQTHRSASEGRPAPLRFPIAAGAVAGVLFPALSWQQV